MNTAIRKIEHTLVAMTLLFAAAEGQEVTKVGTTAAKFLSIPVGARSVGMGGAFVAVADDASGLYWNPAGIARMTQSEAVFHHASWIADMNFNFAGVAVPLEGMGTIGLSFTSLTMDEMERTTVEQPEGTGQFFSAGSFALSGSYAKTLTEWFSIGGSVKYIHEYIFNSSASAIGFDVGSLFTTPFQGLKFGAAISNFGQKLQMTGDDLLVQSGNTNANLTTDNFDLPLLLRIGVAYEAISTDEQQLLLVADAIHPNDNSESVSLGGEYSLLKRMLFLRGGYRNLGAKDSEEEFTVGGGLKYQFQANFSVKFDYAYEKFGRLENVNKFTIGLLF